MTFRTNALQLLAVSTLTVPAMATPCNAQQAPASIDIPAGPMAGSLRKLALRSGRNILFKGNVVAGRVSHAASGAGTAENALDQMLRGKGVTYRRQPDGSLIVVALQPERKRPATTAAIVPVPTVAADPVLGEEADIVVTGSYSRSLATAIARKRNASEIVDSITAEDVGKFPSRNIGEALLRIPGVTVDRVSAGARGQAVFINVRGLPAYFQNVQLNGRDIATNENVESSGQNGRSFRFDLLPPDIVSAVDVYKTPSAAMSEGGIAASIDLRTYRPLDIGTFGTLNVRGSRNDLSRLVGVTASGLTSWTNADKTFGIVASGAYTDQHDREDRNFTSPYTLGANSAIAANRTAQFAGVYMPQAQRPTIEQYYTRRATGTLAMQYRPSDEFETNVDFLYSTQTNRYNQPGLQFDIANSVIDPASAVIRDGVLVAGSSNRMEIQTVNETSTQRYDIFSGGINQRWSPGRWTITGDFNHSLANSRTKDPVERVQYSAFAPASFDFTNGPGSIPTLATGLNLLDPTLAYRGSGTMLARVIRSRTRLDVAKLDVAHSFDGFLSSVSAGGALEDRNRTYFRLDRNSTAFIGTTPSAAGPNSLLPLGLRHVFRDVDGEFPRNWLQPNLPALFDRYFDPATLNTPQTPTDLATSSELSERSAAGYAMAAFAAPVGGVRISGNVGVRVVYTDQRARGYANPGGGAAAIPIDVTQRYTELLPALNVKADLTDELTLRLGYARQMSRPQPELLAPGLTVTLQNGTGRGGNPTLKPFLSNNLDASLEWYFSRLGKVSIAAFDKEFDNYLTQQVSQVSVPNNFGFDFYNITTQVNGGAARLYGLEFGYQQTLDFLPGALSGLGIEASYTRVFQKSNFAVAAGSTETRTVNNHLLGVSPSSYSLVGFYEKGLVSGRLGYVWREAYLQANGGVGQVDTYFDSFGSLDGSFSVAVTPTTSVTLSAVNLLRSSLSQYGRTAAGGKVPGEAYAYGRTLSLGAQFKF
ncbi:TonB-dependent receptor [Sphingomonas sp. Leaf21]|uniref:TonB-dependent receptor n=1 Tax=Sphingomonas sp. Leaf21 TaxID=2876550 RepID=UPI001E2E97AD|nr:TonB-dependent receptor [Sphingomonas sp. Leaf21]